jgi:uracil-DNA glycosylase
MLSFAHMWRELESILVAPASTDLVFNQYRDSNPDYDLPDAAAIRTDNLRAYLEQATRTASVLMVGEAAGPWGCRFSGIPFTGERQLLDPTFPYHGRQSSRAVPAHRTRIKPPYMERTAEMFWGMMLPYYTHIVVWNTFPLQPHTPNVALSIRAPTRQEVSAFRDALQLMRSFVRPARTVAIGRVAQRQLLALGEPAEYVRHPSQGGQDEFAKGISRLLEKIAAE